MSLFCRKLSWHKYLPLLIVLFILFPSPAYAYLDPGSGNALITLIFVVLGGIVFSLKSVFYFLVSFLSKQKTKKGRLPSPKKKKISLIIFSEGKNYELTFKPLVERLVASGQTVFLATLDLEDPLLNLNDPLFEAQYLGEPGTFSYQRLQNLRGRIMLSTTPNIGAPGFPLKRPPKIDNLVHLFHSCSGIGHYKKYSLDSYDTVLTGTPFAISEIRHLETKRGLKAKEVKDVGIPYFDELARKVTSPPQNPSCQQNLLFAPSWGDKNFLAKLGMEWFSTLFKKNYELIIRPHPYSAIFETDFFSRLEQQLKKLGPVSFDWAIDPTDSFLKGDLLVSSRSSVRFDYALLHQKPVITVATAISQPETFELSDLPPLWEEEIERKLGPVVSLGEGPDKLISSFEKAFETPKASYLELREKIVPEFGKSCENIVTWLTSHLS